MIDPIKENYPACTMPLSSTSPTHITPEIMRNVQYAQDYIAHVALVRELLDQASLSTNATLLERSNNKLLQSLSGLLKGSSSCELTEEPIPVWNLVRVLRTKSDAEQVKQTVALMNGEDGVDVTMPCAPMPTPEGDAPVLANAARVTSLTESQPLLHQGRVISGRAHPQPFDCLW